MGSTSSSQSFSKVGTDEQSVFPSELIRKIASFLDAKEFFSTFPLICILFRNLSRNSARYEEYIFNRSRTIHFESKLYLKAQSIQDPRYFRPNVTLPLKEIMQPMEIRVDIFTISDSKEINLNEASSMIIELPTLNGTSNDVHARALNFLSPLFKNQFGKLKNLRLSGFRMNESLWRSISELHVDWFQLTYPFFDSFKLDSIPFPTTRRLYLELREYFDSDLSRCLPSSLEEIFIRFTSPACYDSTANISRCVNLKVM